jgi:hypothetical protein
MATTPTGQTNSTPRAARPWQSQPRPATATMAPSQRRAAERRAAAQHRHAVQRWLRNLTQR